MVDDINYYSGLPPLYYHTWLTSNGEIYLCYLANNLRTRLTCYLLHWQIFNGQVRVNIKFAIPRGDSSSKICCHGATWLLTTTSTDVHLSRKDPDSREINGPSGLRQSISLSPGLWTQIPILESQIREAVDQVIWMIVTIEYGKPFAQLIELRKWVASKSRPQFVMEHEERQTNCFTLSWLHSTIFNSFPPCCHQIRQGNEGQKLSRSRSL